ncbi:MAG: glycosyltransferase family 4 protein [Pseudomonadota bacterium]
MPELKDIAVIAPNLKRRLSGVTSTVVRLVPIQAAEIGVAVTGFGLPGGLPHVPLRRILAMPRDRVRVWHARRNIEMLAGIVLKVVLRRRLKLLFTSAAQRHHTAYTRWLIRQMDAVIATSEKSASFLERPATVVMHGIDGTAFAPCDDKSKLRRTLGLPQGRLVGVFGRVRAQKGTDTFVKSAIIAMASDPDLHALIIGVVTPKERGFAQGLRSLISDAGIADRFHFKDYLDWPDLVEHYRALDLFCAPARTEGFGLTPLEAMASGVPPIATRAGAFEEQIVDGETGRIIDAGDPDVLADAMRDAFSDPVRLKAWAVAGRARVEQLFSIEREASQINAVYRQLLEPAAD